jgi:hypothetical protein
MKPPSLDDRRIKVTAYLTDETFGYDHWRAAQYSAPDGPTCRPALLLVFDTEAQRDAAFGGEAQVIAELQALVQRFKVEQGG